jgi:uncharacterized protein YjbJ (UPF0337 family)
MNDDQIKGKLKQAEGKAIDAKGDLTNDPDDDLKGKAKQVEGKVQEAFGDVKKAVHNATR